MSFLLRAKIVERIREESSSKEETRVSTDACWDSARKEKNCAATGSDDDTGITTGYNVVSRIRGNRNGDLIAAPRQRNRFQIFVK